MARKPPSQPAKDSQPSPSESQPHFSDPPPPGSPSPAAEAEPPAAPQDSPLFLESATRSWSRGWRFPPLPWVLRLALPEASPRPRSILCLGPGDEPLLLASALEETAIHCAAPGSEFVEHGRTAASNGGYDLLHYHLCAATRELASLPGQPYDLILCPQLPSAFVAFQNLLPALSPLLAPAGALLLHLPAHHRAAGEALRLLAAWRAGTTPPPACPSENWPALAALLAGTPSPRAADAEAFLGTLSDPPASLPGLLDALRTAGFHLVGSSVPPRVLPRWLLPHGISSTGLLWNEVALLLNLAPLQDGQTFTAAFRQEPPQEPPWHDPAQLAAWRPACPFIPNHRLPLMRPPWDTPTQIRVEIQGLLSPQEFQTSALVAELLRRANGSDTLQSILSAIGHPVSPENLLHTLYFFHHTTILRLLPPSGTPDS